jgi:hypothetical protein
MYLMTYNLSQTKLTLTPRLETSRTIIIEKTTPKPADTSNKIRTKFAIYSSPLLYTARQGKKTQLRRLVKLALRGKNGGVEICLRAKSSPLSEEAPDGSRKVLEPSRKLFY